MVKHKVKIRETFIPDDIKPWKYKRIWIVSHNGQSQVYDSDEEARIAKAELEKS